MANAKILQARELYNQGRQSEAASLFRDVVDTTTNKRDLLNATLGLITSADRIEDNEFLIQKCDTGIGAAQSLNEPGAIAYLLGMKAQFVHDAMTFLVHEKSNITLAPGWKSFSIERDQTLHEKLSAEMEKSEKQVQELMEKAFDMAKQVGDPDALGQIYLFAGEMHGQAFLRVKTECIGEHHDPRFLYKLHFLQRRNWDSYFMYGKKCRIRLREEMRLCIENFESAIECHEETGDVGSEAYAKYNLAIQLQTFGKFGKAKKLLSEVEILAKRVNNPGLAARAKIVKASLKKRNSDIPNYIEGERRDIEGQVQEVIKSQNG